MPEKLKKELDRWEDRSNKIIKKLGKSSGKVSKELRVEYKELRADSIELIKQIDKRLDEVKQKDRDALRKLKRRAQDATKKLVDAWLEAEEEPIYPFTLPNEL
jgi:hypothetical protein